MNENIEVLDEDFIPVEEKKEEVSNNNASNVIGLDRLFSSEEVIDAYEDDKLKEEKKQKKITRIQVILILVLVVIASLTYFFGYDILKPFIKID